MIRRPPRSTPKPSSAASDVYKRQKKGWSINNIADANKGKWATNDVLLWYAAKKIEHKDKIEPVTQIWDAGTNTIDSK